MELIIVVIVGFATVIGAWVFGLIAMNICGGLYALFTGQLGGGRRAERKAAARASLKARFKPFIDAAL